MALASLVDYWSVSFSLGFEKSYGHKSLLLHGAFLDTCNFLLQKCIVAGGRHHMRLFHVTVGPRFFFHVTVGPRLTRQWPFLSSVLTVKLSGRPEPDVEDTGAVAGSWTLVCSYGQGRTIVSAPSFKTWTSHTANGWFLLGPRALLGKSEMAYSGDVHMQLHWLNISFSLTVEL